MTRWPEGVLPRQVLREFIEAGYIVSDTEIPDRNLQPASIDLTLGPVAYRLRSSFLPSNGKVREKLRDYHMGDLDLSGDGAVLEQDRPYLIPLQERVQTACWHPRPDEPAELDRPARRLHPRHHRQRRALRRGP